MFRISLDEFEGPLDLLLFFIKRDELDIYNIPVSKITADFISYISEVRILNLEIAAEFIYMASMLMSIKANMLLPRPAEDGSSADEFDPRTELVQRLLEYKRIKEASTALDQLARERETLFARSFFEEFEPEVIDELDEPVNRPTLYHLMQAYKSVLENMPRTMTRSVSDAPVTVEEQTLLILKRLEAEVQVSFTSVLEGITERIILVVTFLAVLEMCKNRRIIVLVKDGHDDFWITQRAGA
ncbi:segregation/condensation protein A [Chlorobium sp. BLA1]|uniref:segregation and condensation protein A n=1 Tax=Candidatus Chlorobium masyuteum TaxID=2716876 RepID=UPI0014201E47|nr:segregation/condensation protein A [Candidatus Chlorobium masyuteum]NHQ59552.1 segregation/condensation protein A [Candidatus Chlorobium masyuteum]NTU45801.1 segregation/condensation protein A [Chlorobiaceae bacterium]